MARYWWPLRDDDSAGSSNNFGGYTEKTVDLTDDNGVYAVAGLGFGGLAVALAIRPTLEDLMGGIPRCLPVGFIQPVTVTSDRRRSRFSMSTTK